MKLCCGSLTFDQPLYLKANHLKHSHLDEKIHARVGGFYQLTSFLGAGCKLSEGSGIEELWENIYAKNTIAKMTGKAYTKCIRAWFLTDNALRLTLMRSFFSSKEPALDSLLSGFFLYHQ